MFAGSFAYHWFCRWLCVAFAPWLCLLFALPRLRERYYHYDGLYQDFIDAYPISEYNIDVYHNWKFAVPRAHHYPSLYDRFDWLVSVGASDSLNGGIRYRVKDPQTVLIGPHAVHWLSSSLDTQVLSGEIDPNRTGRSLVIAGNAWCVSATFGADPVKRAEKVNDLRRYFEHIFMVGMDVEVDGVSTLPTGMSENYLRTTVGLLGTELALAAIASARVTPEVKTRSALASFGKFTNPSDGTDGPLKWLKHNGTGVKSTTETMLHYATHPHYTQTQTTSTCHIMGQVAKVISRWTANRYVHSSQALEAGVENRMIPGERWWAELATYRFILSPTGDGLQSPKMIEALLVLTVPILQRGNQPVHDDLVRFGFPVVIVDEWEEISKTSLSNWWEELAPRLPSFRARCLTTDTYWAYIIGQIKQCV